MAVVGRFSVALHVFLPSAGLLACCHGELTGSTWTTELRKAGEGYNWKDAFALRSEQGTLTEKEDPVKDMGKFQLDKESTWTTELSKAGDGYNWKYASTSRSEQGTLTEKQDPVKDMGSFNWTRK